jgi:molybdate transport system substrate-binding protein
MTSRLLILALVALTAAPAYLGAQGRGSVTVAAASDLQTALPALAAGFERKTGIKVTVTFGSSGNFVAQIQNGAPFDIFFSADADYPRRLASGGYVDPASVYEYAIGRLVLWTRTDSGVDITSGLPALRDARVKRIAIANPSVAPYGRAAAAALKSSERLYDVVERKLVFAENLSQAAQMAESGNADVALLGHALALDRRLQAAGRFVGIPTRLHPPIVQAVAIVSSSRNKANARALLDYAKSPEARATFESFGFEVPQAAR